MSIQVDCVKLHKHTVTYRATTKIAIQRDILKNIRGKSKWNTKKILKPQEGRKRETKEKGNEYKTIK